MKFLLILLLCKSFSTQQKCGEDKHCLLEKCRHGLCYECSQDTDCSYADECINRHCVPKPCEEECGYMYECRHGVCRDQDSQEFVSSGGSRSLFECNTHSDCLYQCEESKCVKYDN
ncbi:unnamed protein product [Caenorhabditis brenneri]